MLVWLYFFSGGALWGTVFLLLERVRMRPAGRIALDLFGSACSGATFFIMCFFLCNGKIPPAAVINAIGGFIVPVLLFPKKREPSKRPEQDTRENTCNGDTRKNAE